MKNKNLLLLAGAAVLAYYLLKKKKPKAGVPIIESIDEGFLESNTGSNTTVIDSVNVDSNTGVSNRIEYIGIMPVSYSSINGSAKKQKMQGGICSGILK